MSMRIAALVATLFIASACTAPADLVAPANGQADGPLATTAVAENATAEQNALSALTRILAVSLRDEPARGRIRAAMATRGVTHELKLDFQSLVLTSPGDGLRRHMAASAGIGVDSLSALLTTVRPLEVYIPVRSHRRTWTGGSVLVASQLYQSDLPTAYREDGSELRLSLSTPPAETVISLVPRETNLSQPAYSTRVGSGTTLGPGGADRQEGCEPNMDYCEGDPSSGGGPSVPTTAPSGLYMTYTDLYDAAEPWIRGDPEIEAHILGPELADPASSARQISCTGEHEISWKNFNQNSNQWSGAVLLLSEEQLVARGYTTGTTEERGFSVILYEDDDGSCIIHDDNERLTNDLIDVAGWFGGGVLCAVSVTSMAGFVIQVGIAAWLTIDSAISLFQTNDDYLGVAVPGANATQYTNPAATHTLVKRHDAINGGIELVYHVNRQ